MANKNELKYIILHKGKIIDTADSAEESRELGAYWVSRLNSPDVKVVPN